MCAYDQAIHFFINIPKLCQTVQTHLLATVEVDRMFEYRNIIATSPNPMHARGITGINFSFFTELATECFPADNGKLDTKEDLKICSFDLVTLTKSLL